MLHKKTFTKKAPDIFCIQVQDLYISDVFYKIQNLKKWQMKAVVPFLPRNLKLHSPWWCRQKYTGVCFSIAFVVYPGAKHRKQNKNVGTKLFWKCGLGFLKKKFKFCLKCTLNKIKLIKIAL